MTCGPCCPPSVPWEPFGSLRAVWRDLPVLGLGAGLPGLLDRLVFQLGSFGGVPPSHVTIKAGCPLFWSQKSGGSSGTSVAWKGLALQAPVAKTKVPAGPLERSHPERVLPCVSFRAAQAARVRGFQKERAGPAILPVDQGPFAGREGPPRLRLSPGSRGCLLAGLLGQARASESRFDGTPAPMLVLVGQGAIHRCANILKAPPSMLKT